MPSVFITNQSNSESNLRQRLMTLVKDAEVLKFLVGFFYFSGIQELYDGLVKNSQVILKILVGMNTEKIHQQIIEYAYSNPAASDNQSIDRYLQDVCRSLNDKDFDNQQFYEQIKYFIEMIQENRLQIRKTREPNHAKVYIVIDEDNPMKQKLFITGSSNLTRPGLTTQAEFNVEIADFGGDEAEKYFDQLWEDSIRITEVEDSKSKLIKALEKDTLARAITPFEAYVLTLKAYLDVYNPNRNLTNSLEQAFKRNDYTPYRYQMDAVKQALNTIEQNNGVIIADVVGLGKSVIACAVAKELGKRGIVLCPPGLMGDINKRSGWRMYLEQFGLYDWEIRSTGDLEKASDFVRETNDIKIVIVDEVHRFRNQNTKDYENLKNICRDKTVILLTATPFNNRPADILSLLELFIVPKKSTITLDSNLTPKFRVFKNRFEDLSDISKYYNSPEASKRKRAEEKYRKVFGEKSINLIKVRQEAKLLSGEIRDVIAPVVIRRNRLDLINNPYYQEEIRGFSIVADPKELFFELSPVQSEFYDRIIEKYFASPNQCGSFTAAIYQPFMYETSKSEYELGEKENFEFIQQRQLSDFMRRLLVKRFESSFGAFDVSIRRFKKITENVLTLIQKTNKHILDRNLIEKIYLLDDDEIEQELEAYSEKISNGDFSKNRKIYEINDFKRKEEFLKDIRSDLGLFEEIIKQLDEMNLVSDDPKSARLIEYLHVKLNAEPKDGEPKRKILIFSEYADTVRHLCSALKPVFGNRLLVISGNLSDNDVETINKNFDASNPEPADDYDVLLSTDRISEGFNLNRAGVVINYDVPWNPVRVIQRVGRINRISKRVFKELYIVNFFPTEKGAQLVQSRDIAASKMYLIHNILGEDAKIFDVDEEPTASELFTRITRNPEEAEEVSFYTKMLNRFLEIQKKHPDLVKELDSFPARVKVLKKGKRNEMFVFFKKGRLFIQRSGENNQKPESCSFEQIVAEIECREEEPRFDLTSEFWKIYQQMTKKIRESSSRELASPNDWETKAKNNLVSLIGKKMPKLQEYQKFMETVYNDICNYGTLPDYTLRRIVNLKFDTDSQVDTTKDEIMNLRIQLGEDYLERVITSLNQSVEEIIIAIGNQNNDTINA